MSPCWHPSLQNCTLKTASFSLHFNVLLSLPTWGHFNKYCYLFNFMLSLRHIHRVLIMRKNNLFSSSKLFLKTDLLPSPNVSAVTCCSCFSEPPTGAQSPHRASGLGCCLCHHSFPSALVVEHTFPCSPEALKARGRTYHSDFVHSHTEMSQETQYLY